MVGCAIWLPGHKRSFPGLQLQGQVACMLQETAPGTCVHTADFAAGKLMSAKGTPAGIGPALSIIDWPLLAHNLLNWLCCFLDRRCSFLTAVLFLFQVCQQLVRDSHKLPLQSRCR